MQQIRIALRGHAVVLMGKNTMMRKAIRGHLQNNPQLELLLPHIKGNIGFVFTKEDLVTIRDMVLANKVKAPARAGAIAPLDVQIPAQNTGLGPEKTSFFQALNIPTKITKGTIEIIQNVDLIKTGDKVGMSESTLLNMLGISPFTYGLIVKKVSSIHFYFKIGTFLGKLYFIILVLSNAILKIFTFFKEVSLLDKIIFAFIFKTLFYTLCSYKKYFYIQYHIIKN